MSKENKYHELTDAELEQAKERYDTICLTAFFAGFGAFGFTVPAAEMCQQPILEIITGSVTNFSETAKNAYNLSAAGIGISAVIGGIAIARHSDTHASKITEVQEEREHLVSVFS